MPIVQTATGNTSWTVPVGTVINISQAFSSPVTAGNGLLVVLGANADNIDYPNFASLADSQGNTYTQLFVIKHVTNGPPALAVFYCAHAVGGADTLTGTYTTDWLGFGAHTGTFGLYIIAAEFSGVSALQSFDDASNFAAPAASMTLTLGSGASATVTAHSSSGYNSWGLVDLIDSGADTLFACGMVGLASAPPNIPGSDTFTGTVNKYSKGTLITDTPSTGSAVDYLALYKLGPGGIQQPQVYVIT